MSDEAVCRNINQQATATAVCVACVENPVPHPTQGRSARWAAPVKHLVVHCTTNFRPDHQRPQGPHGANMTHEQFDGHRPNFLFSTGR
jgi:hypothetical protein